MNELSAGSQLDHYTLDRIVAKGGMATVYEARDRRTGATVAIKIPHPEVEADPALFERFAREQTIGLTMDHPGVVKVLRSDDRSCVYMVMEWVPGRLLRDVLREHPSLSPERAAAIAASICDALDYLHRHGVVHRDLKPDNIMLDSEDHIRLIDFGIAANVGARRLTFANFSTMLGTPDYIAPEQVKGKRGDARTDLYSLGIILYEMLTDTLPFQGANPFTVMNDRLLNAPAPPRQLNPGITPQVEEIVFRAMERDPINRYQSAREMAEDLRHPERVVLTPRAAAPAVRLRRSPTGRVILLYVGLAAIPLVIFALLLFAARHH